MKNNKNLYVSIDIPLKEADEILNTINCVESEWNYAHYIFRNIFPKQGYNEDSRKRLSSDLARLRYLLSVEIFKIQSITRN